MKCLRHLIGIFAVLLIALPCRAADTVIITGHGSIKGNPFSFSTTVILSTPTPGPTATATPALCIHITAPATGTSVNGNVAVTTNDTCTGVWFERLFVDGVAVTPDFPTGGVLFNTSGYSNGSHTLKITSQSANPNTKTLGFDAITVMVHNAPGPTGTPTPTPAPAPTTIPSLTGSASGISGADAKDTDFGRNVTAVNNSRDGFTLCCGPLLTDAQAASHVIHTVRSGVETGGNGAANIAANKYFATEASTNPSGYLNELAGFYSAYTGSGWQAEADRIDGACPFASPTTAEVMQWAAAKWGINPILLYADANSDGDWDQTAIGDNGTSGGILQVADRGANHAWPGFSGTGSMLARENTCFNADFFAGRMWAVFNNGKAASLTGECSNVLDIGGAIQTWLDGSATCGVGSWTQELDAIMVNKTWQGRFFGGASVPGAW
jgi:hypothetical protein